MYTLGINAVFHDSAACIIKDGILLAATEEERFTHFKHGKRPVPFSTWELPFHAIDYCLKIAGIHINDVDHIAYSFDPYLLIGAKYRNKSTIEIPFEEGSSALGKEFKNVWDPLFLSSIVNAPGQLRDGYPHHLQKRFVGCNIQRNKWHFVEHHISHAASAFNCSPFKNAAVMTVDGRGELATTTYNIGNGQQLSRIGQVNMPHSLGLLYEDVTTYLGFLHSSDEYKVMALASYGKPEFIKDFREIVQISGNGQYTINNQKLEERFGPKRLRHEEFTSHHFNVAHSLQLVIEESMLELTGWLKKETGEENLCLAGGVALNCVANARIRDRGAFKNIWVQPASGDDGTALGAAIWVDAQERQTNERNCEMTHCYWGPEYTDEEIEKSLKLWKVPYRKLDDIAGDTAEILAQDKIIGWYQGRMEFGPRALGSRSILASPINAAMQARLNEVKDREDFRPVAPVVLEEEAHNWFEGAGYSPFMLFVYDVKPDEADKVAAIRHVDGTARIQTINRQQHQRYHDLLKAFYKKTGVPVLVNTSFNTLGKPIVCTPRDAIECFWTSPFDALVIGSFIVEK
ncbi:beta-1,4-N-acetylglucosamine oligosaccharide 6-O-carbamoyltransferase NodU [Mucilaginibacter pineti]|uniref:Beta-1,4-N-acetylglucosamine oligosaccharide 6-O-carbamoyltransferase NodU n=1 Tax=Mucilaginibacter pineti TaxID=1391627 RepID=A0A1G7H727_9SPHI|nr:carbamoyltransferase C-terminal domain-containing protein [Mucilaginibacter pineti]SDE96206.1 beta-1,4-N-acetylglucosamine oligosaccharide 6-O-carbamoyltransferase NodU [Mucilaginibacter pineti]